MTLAWRAEEEEALRFDPLRLLYSPLPPACASGLLIAGTAMGVELGTVMGAELGTVMGAELGTALGGDARLGREVRRERSGERVPAEKSFV